jgi:O-antigen/teichoic acid export membrane protein
VENRKTHVILISNYAGQGWSALMNIVFIPVYIRYLGIEAYGLIGAFTVILMSASLLDAGMTPTLNREMARFRAGEHSDQSIGNLLRSVELLCVSIIGIIWIIGLLTAGWLSRNWLGNNNFQPDFLRVSVFLMIVTASLRVVEGVYRGALLGLQRHVTMNLCGALFATLRGGGAALAIMFIAPTVQVFFLWQAAVLTVSVVTFGIVVHRALPQPPTAPSFSCSALNEVRSFAGGVLLTSVLALMLTQIDKVVLVKILPLESFAYYALAGAVVAGLYQLVGPVSQSYYPRLTELFARNDAGALATTYHDGAQILAVTVAPPAALMIFFSDPILRLWTGNPVITAGAAPILTLLAIGSLLHAMMYMPYMLQLAAGWSGFAVRVNAIAVCILVPAIFVVVPRYGAHGAAAIWVALTTCYVVGSAHFMHRRLLPEEKWRWYLHDIGLPVGAAMGVTGLAAVAFPVDLSTFGTIAFLSATGLGAFAIALLTLRPVRRRLRFAS